MDRSACRISAVARRVGLAALGAATLVALPGVAVAEGAASRPPLQIVVSLNQQTMRVFAGSEEIARTNISSGKRGYSTPTGIFSILHKKRYHRSNQYSNAPMPWMQRLTWTGIALHESPHVPDYPASHGCVRIPGEFAAELYGMTGLGEHVIITGDEVVPSPIRHALLPERTPEAGPYDHWLLRMQAGGSMNRLPAISSAAMLEPVRNVQFASTGALTKLPVRVLITRRSHADLVTDVQTLLLKLGHYDGNLDGAAGPATFAAIRSFRAENGLPAGTAMDQAFLDALYAKAGVETPANARLYVRGDFEPLFNAPITLDNPDQPLGTHLIVASAGEDGSLRWSAMTLENRLSTYQRSYYGIVDETVGSSTTAALDRIHLSAETAARLAEILGPGASIAISDTGISGLTGWKTDFVVLTRLDSAAEPPKRLASPRKQKVKRAAVVKQAPPKPARRVIFPWLEM